MIVKFFLNVTGTSSAGQSEPMCNDNGGLLYISQAPRTGALPSDTV